MGYLLESASGCPGYLLTDLETGKDILYQTDWDYPSLASMLGWSVSEVRPESVQWNSSLHGFSLDLPWEMVTDCAHSGPCDDDVAHWAGLIDRPESATPEALIGELRETGGWTMDELTDDSANWERVLWLAAHDCKENPCEHEGTDGTVDCPGCGLLAHDFITAAAAWLDDNCGYEVDADCSELFESIGGDESEGELDDDDDDDEYKPWCDQCAACMINGIPCHETGCPNEDKVWDDEEDRWVTPADDDDDESED